MDTEVKTAVDALGHAFEEFKKANDQKLSEIEKKGVADPITLEKVEKINGVISDLQGSVKAFQAKAEALETAFKRHPGGNEGEQKAQAELERKALRAFASKGGNMYADEFFASNPEFKALSVGDDSAGGYTVLPDMTGRMVMKIYESSPIRQISSVATISTDSLEGYLDNDEASQGWVGETGTRSETNTPTIGKWSIPVHEQYAEPRATQKLLDDSAWNMEAWLNGKVADKMARTENTAFVSGNGADKPRGFTAYTTAATADSSRGWGTMEHLASGSNGALGTSSSHSADKLITLVHKLKSDYRNGAVWVMNRATVGAVRQLKDGQGAYLWLPSYTANQPATLLGYPVIEAEDMTDYTTTDALGVAFGNFRTGYQIVDRQGIRILRDPYTAKPYVKFYTTKRVGGDVLNFEAIKFLKSATA